MMLRPEIAGRLMAEAKRIENNQGKMRKVLKVMRSVSNAELEVIRLVSSGLSYRQIAEKRFVEDTTIRTEIHFILQKFGKRRMKDLIAELREINFFETLGL
jgi:DNA-binding NarL/FixJ family response regulator